MIEIKEIIEKNIWEEFVLGQPNNSFFQSWNWGEAQRNAQCPMPNAQCIWRIGIYDRDELVGIAQIVKITAKRGSYLHLRHGPILKEWQEEYFSALLKFLKGLGLKEKAWFIRMSPLIENSLGHKNFFRKFGFLPVVIPRLDASLSWVLEVNQSEKELLLKMRKTTRYLIHKAEKMGVVVYEAKEKDDFAVFSKIYRETAKRQHFVPHRGIEEEFSILGKADQAKLFLAKYQGKAMAGALIVFYGNQAVYHHSGSILDSSVPAMHSLLWKAILEAKKRGKTFFNFWGISPPDKRSDPWWGLTLFKTGFGGEAKEFLPAHDLPLSPFYRLTRFIETLWKIKRHY